MQICLAQVGPNSSQEVVGVCFGRASFSVFLGRPELAQEIACKAQEISLQGARKKSGLAGKAKNRCDRAKNSCDKASCLENGVPC